MLRVIATGGSSPKRPAFDPTSQQRDVFDALTAGGCNVAVEARAGTGKSVTCAEAMWRVYDHESRTAGRTPSQVYLTFSKALADEFCKRALPPGAVAATYHSHCYRAVRKAFNSTVVDHPNAKTWEILDGIHGARPRMRPGSEVVRKKVRGAVCKLLSLAKNTLSGTRYDQLESLATQYEIDVAGSEEEIFGLTAAAYGVAAMRRDVIDFDDQLWLALICNLRFPPVDVLFVDEAQDLNRLQQELINLICPTGRVVVVGDRFQSIFGFRGADSQSIPRLQEYLGARRGGLHGSPLTETFRCPRSHVERVQRLVPDYVAHASNPEGAILDGVSTDDILGRSKPGDMLICRNNAPLVGACLRLVSRGVPAIIRGRDIGQDLIDLITSWQPDDLDDVEFCLTRWVRKQKAKLADHEDPAPRLERIDDTAAAIRTVADTCETGGQLFEKLRSIFGDSIAGKVVLSSVHRAKGLEAERVAILRPELLGGGKATTDEARQQERNLEYVAGTRSKSVLEFEGS